MRFRLSFFELLLTSFLGFATFSDAAPVIHLADTRIDFGTVIEGYVVQHSFAVCNDGQDPLVIERLEFSESSMNGRARAIIGPGESAPIAITWDTSAARGPVEGRVILYTNDPAHPRVILTLKGTVKGLIEFDPRPALYMTQFNGEESRGSITIRNNQERPLRIVRLVPMGTHFRASCTMTKPGREFDLNVVVPSDTEAGRFREHLILHTNDPQHPRLHVEVNVLVKPDIFVDPAIVDFGTVSRSEFETQPQRLELLQQTFVVSRRSGVMKVRSVNAGADFLTASVNPAGPANAFKVDVGLIASRLSPGPIDAELRLVTDDPRHSTVAIRVVGAIRD